MDGSTSTAMTSNISEHGVFVRTRRGLDPGKIVEMEFVLPSGEHLTLRGEIRRTIRTRYHFIKNGMGIEFIDPPKKLLEYLRSLQ